MTSWFPFWRSRNRFSLDELRYLTDQLYKVQVVNQVNKEFVVEALRSIAELITFGDQNDPSFFEYFMERQLMGEFARMLRVSATPKVASNVALQLLQTMSIMIQNLRSEHAIYYIFSNEHINYLISYPFDFRNDELLSYYISFLRAISGKLNMHTISLLVKAENDAVTAFPLYTAAIKFALHEENMIRTAVRALTLNVYHVGDECVNNFVSFEPQSNYFSNLVTYLKGQCISLDGWVLKASMDADSDYGSHIAAAIEEIEDSLYYFSDVISAGIPEFGRLISDNLLQIIVFPLLLPSLRNQSAGLQIGSRTSLYLLCCILRIVKDKDLSAIVASTLFCPPDNFVTAKEAVHDDTNSKHGPSQEHSQDDPSSSFRENNESSTHYSRSTQINGHKPKITLREILLSNIKSGDETHTIGSLIFLATLLQTKELDESVLDGLGILPQRKQHKKLLLQALVGEVSGEEQLFCSENGTVKDGVDTELEKNLQKFKDKYRLSFRFHESVASPRKHRCQVLDALAHLFCRSYLSSETLWTGGWLLRQLIPHGEEEFTTNHLKQLKDSHEHTVTTLLEEVKGTWCDTLLSVLQDEWRNCKRAIEASSPQRDPKSILLPPQTCLAEGGSSFAAGERMREAVKVFVLQSQLLVFSSGGLLPDYLPLPSPPCTPKHLRPETTGFEISSPRPGSEINLENSVPCRIAFERGKEHHLKFLAVSRGTSGWILLSEESPLKPRSGIVRVTAPLAGSDPRIDEKHSKWLHLRIRPYSLPSLDPLKKSRSKKLVDGRWTLAFSDEQSCKAAESMIIEHMKSQQTEIEGKLCPLLNQDFTSVARHNSNSSHKSSS